jgi:hypothetical protein
MANIIDEDFSEKINFIKSWYEDQNQAIIDYEIKVISSINEGSINTISKFLGMNSYDIKKYFLICLGELEHLYCFYLISTTEACLRKDFQFRVTKREKSLISKKFRDIVKTKKSNKKGKIKISLVEDILETWKEQDTVNKLNFSRFIGLLNYRDWLAHGRYWIPNFGQKYTPKTCTDITSKIIEIVESY